MDDEDRPPSRQKDEGEDDAVFDWAEYLERTRAEKAPRSAFFQPQEVPSNHFKVGQLILAKDENSLLMVLCRIRRVHKCWIYVHIEGLDENRFRWFMCDARDIAPIAPKNPNVKVDYRGAYPPTGLNSIFKRWIVQQFEGQEDNIADVSLFRTIAEGYFPRRNQFSVGMKLAAFDQALFDGKLLPATVVAVIREKIRLNFDGWPSGYDITVPFYSRCIFPIDFLEGSGITINVPPLPDPVENVKEQMQSPGATASPDTETEHQNPLKRRRMAFFDDSWKPQTPHMRMVVLKEQVTGVQAKVFDILRKASQEQQSVEREFVLRPKPPILVKDAEDEEKAKICDVMRRVSQESKLAKREASTLPSKVDVIVKKDMRREDGQDPSHSLASDGRPRPVAPKTVAKIVYQSEKSGTIYVAKQAPHAQYFPYRQLHPIDARFGTSRLVSVLPTSSFPTRRAVTVSTPAGHFIRADPNIVPALRQTLQTFVKTEKPSTIWKRKTETACLPLNISLRRVKMLPQQGADDSPLQKTQVRVEKYKRETRTVEKDLENAIVKIYVNKRCDQGPMLDGKKVGQLHDYHPLPYQAQIARVVQDIIYCAWVPKEVFDMIKNVGPKVPGMIVTVHYDGRVLTKAIPIHPTAVAVFMWLRDFLTALNCCPYLFSPSEISCEVCDSGEKEPRPSSLPSALERVPKYKREYDVLLKLGARVGSCEYVADHYRKRLGDEVAQLILDNKIDFSVLPYCDENLLREQMRLPYNLALKMAAVACQLRAAAFESVPGIEGFDLPLK